MAIAVSPGCTLSGYSLLSLAASFSRRSRDRPAIAHWRFVGNWAAMWRQTCVPVNPEAPTTMMPYCRDESAMPLVVKEELGSVCRNGRFLQHTARPLETQARDLNINKGRKGDAGREEGGAMAERTFCGLCWLDAVQRSRIKAWMARRHHATHRPPEYYSPRVLQPPKPCTNACSS